MNLSNNFIMTWSKLKHKF